MYQKVIDRALEHIRSQQSPDGSFISLSSFSRTDFADAIPRQTTFFTSNILACLQNIPGDTMDLRNAAAKFLLSQKSECWSFNYWARDASARMTPSYPRYPDDLDDTFAAIAAFARNDLTIIDGHALSAIAKMLIAREIDEGGPYRTWLVSDDALPLWQDVDLVVNSTIGYALSIIGVHIPNVERFVSGAVRQGHLGSPYYPDIFHVGYFLSRFYTNNSTQENADARSTLADIITDRFQKSEPGNITPLEHAMAISSLINLGRTDGLMPMGVLLAKRLEDEDFLPYAFCIDPSRDGRPCYAGASALTVAFAAEALARYSSVASHVTPDPLPIPNAHDHIRSLAKISCRSIGRELCDTALISIEKATDEKITALAYDFRDVLYKSGKVVPMDIIDQLSLANLYGWMAYKIYDDALDGEDAAGFIPCGNFFLRSLANIYHGLSLHIPKAASFFANTMNVIDNANAWEQKYCRLGANNILLRKLPDFGDHHTLADRSIGHAMGPLTELLFLGYDEHSEEYKNCESFFRHYLIARQLHDDAHDWADDLLRGRVNSIGTLLLACWKKKHPPDPSLSGAAIAAVIPRLHKIFWEEIVDETTCIITSHITECRRLRQRSSFLDGTDFMESDLRKLESAAWRAVKERDEVIIFLNDYKTSPPSGAAF